MNLVVSGCSFSDYTEVKNVWGNYTANNLDIDYLHLAGGIGGNSRSLRIITQKIIKGEITANDIVLIQVTEPIRTELPSPTLEITEQGKAYRQRVEVDDTYENQILHYDYLHDNTSIVTRWKMDSSQWQGTDADVRLHEEYQRNVSDAFGKEITVNSLYQLYALCTMYGINFVILWGPLCNEKYFKQYWRENGITVEFPYELDFFKIWEPGKNYYDEDNYKYRLSPTDITHLSELGHETFGKAVSTSLKLFYPHLLK